MMNGNHERILGVDAVRERKIPKHEQQTNEGCEERACDAEEEKRKKTFGKTPDGTGE